MRPRFLADENLNERIITGLLRREPSIDFLMARRAGIQGRPDPDVLAFAATEGRVLVSHDQRTLTVHFRRFVSQQSSPGVVIVTPRLGIGSVIEEILLVWAACDAEELANQIIYIPL
jgi:predicted nuclease of predicted toxin-antitoxin system